MADRLERFINLIAKTGDKLLVYDRHNPDDSFVVVGLGQYESLVSEANGVRGLTEDQLIDKINSDIALWKSSQVTEPPQEAVSMPSNFSVAQEIRPVKANPFGKKPKTSPWTIPESRRREAEEVIDEGRQYIEETPF
ncbi:MAG: hypothetical protein NTY12_01930 [Candidatus Falkowbacteria bacterium]|nr:hypothetical protein [Candidatus Falkowbacteria bacterium]